VTSRSFRSNPGPSSRTNALFPLSGSGLTPAIVIYSALVTVIVIVFMWFYFLGFSPSLLPIG